MKETKASLASVDQDVASPDQEDFHIPSVDLLTAQVSPPVETASSHVESV